MRALAALCALLLGAMSAAGAAAEPPASAVSIGETIYRFGVLPGGAPLRGERESGVPVQGAAADSFHKSDFSLEITKVIG